MIPVKLFIGFVLTFQAKSYFWRISKSLKTSRKLQRNNADGQQRFKIPLRLLVINHLREKAPSL